MQSDLVQARWGLLEPKPLWPRLLLFGVGLVAALVLVAVVLWLTA